MIPDGRTRDLLSERTRFADIRWVAETASTNQDLQALAEAGADEGVVVVADHQTAGRGRLDRRWEARPGDGLLVSVLLRPAQRPELAPSAVALAARRAVMEVAGVEPQLKWPNDLLAPDGAKLAGILAARVGEAVVVGMGLNVHGAPPGAAWLDRLAGRKVSRGDLLGAWLLALEAELDGWAGVAPAYRRHCATVGRPVRVELNGGEVLEGRAESIDESGRLVVADGEGRQVALTVGDVTHLR